MVNRRLGSTPLWLGLLLALGVGLARGETVYVVKRGDTLIEICQAHGVSLAEVVRLNGIGDADLILPGQRVRLPDGVPPSAEDLPQDRPASEQRLSTSQTLPFRNYASLGGNVRGISRVKIAEDVLEHLNQAPPGAAGGFYMASYLTETLVRAPAPDKAIVGGMLALIMTPYSATLASTLGTAPTFAMDAVFPAAKTALSTTIQTTLTSYGRVGDVVGQATSLAGQAGAAVDTVRAGVDGVRSTVDTAEQGADLIEAFLR
ncbi:MAG: LysM domain-containing protein [Planctomycetota bacterium]